MDGCSRRAVVNVLDRDIIVNRFEFHSREYVQFQTNTFGKDMNPLNLLLWIK